MKNDKADRVLCWLSLAVLLFFACSIGVRTVTRQILVKRLGMSNAFTDLVLFDAQNLNDATDATDSITIDWEELYPFAENVGRRGTETQTSKEGNSKLGQYTERITSAEDKVEIYATDFLPGYQALTELAKGYEDLIQWNFVPYSEYNGIITMSDGYLTGIKPKSDTTEAASSAIALKQHCDALGIDFLYIQAPKKISKFDDTDISGVTDFSNQNADDFLASIQKAGANTLDLREVIREEGLVHHSLFFRTDHHWKPESGLWASRHILQTLRDACGYQVDPSVLDPNHFETVTYPDWFLGSQGKKVTLAQAAPEDFTLLYPTYRTQLHYEIQSKGIDADGDFSILYDMKQVEKLDYYGKNPYGAYIYADQPFERIYNPLASEERHILVIHDSFGNCVVPFLAMEIQHVDSMDLRHFTGSVQTFIEIEKPDLVMILYSPDLVTNEEATDFR